MRAEFVHYVLDMIINSRSGDTELVSDFRSPLTLCKHLQDFFLTCSELHIRRGRARLDDINRAAVCDCPVTCPSLITRPNCWINL